MQRHSTISLLRYWKLASLKRLLILANDRNWPKIASRRDYTSVSLGE